MLALRLIVAALTIFLANQTFATTTELFTFFADLEGGLCRSANDEACTGNGIPPQPFNLQLIGEGDELKGSRRFEVDVSGFKCIADLTVEKSGPYYTLRIAMSDSTTAEVKAEHLSFFTRVRNVGPMALRTRAGLEGRHYQCLFKYSGKQAFKG